MSSRQQSDTLTIHPYALIELGEEACIVALGVARDLRSGAIPPEKFDMRWVLPSASCGSGCCIAGWMLIRGVPDKHETGTLSFGDVGDLFSASHPSDPQLAADAIERYIYDGSRTPWDAA